MMLQGLMKKQSNEVNIVPPKFTLITILRSFQDVTGHFAFSLINI